MGLGAFLDDLAGAFPVLSANLELNNEPALQGKLQRSVVLTVGGEDIGIVGYTTKETSLLVHPGKYITNKKNYKATLTSQAQSLCGTLIALMYLRLYISEQMNFHFQSLQAVSRYRDPQLQVTEKCLYLQIRRILSNCHRLMTYFTFRIWE